MTSEFRLLVELALAAPHLVNPKLIMSCADEDRELGDLHEWSDNVDSLVAAFESQGDCLLGLRSYSSGGFISWGAFLCMDQGVPEELVVNFTDNKVLNEIHDTWSEKVQLI